MAENEEVDIVGICKDILLALIDGKTPEDVQAALAKSGIEGEDAQNLMNVTIICTQEITPVIEQRVSLDDALKNLTAQGLDANMARGIADMILSVMGQNAVENSGVNPEEETPQVSKEDMTKIMRLAMAVDSDQQRGVPDSNIVEAISKIEGIDDISDVGGKVDVFVSNVRLARKAMERAKGGVSLPEVIKQLGLDKKEPYVAVLALFFLKASVNGE